jgi:hypothetical protein
LETSEAEIVEVDDDHEEHPFEVENGAEEVVTGKRKKPTKKRKKIPAKKRKKRVIIEPKIDTDESSFRIRR